MGLSDEEKKLQQGTYALVKKVQDCLLGTIENPIGLLQREDANTKFRIKWQKNVTTIIIAVIINVLLVAVNIFINYGR